MDPVTHIDLGRLEENARDQPKMMKSAVRKAALWKRKHAEAKAAQELVEAELKIRIRKRPANYGIAKLSEGAVKEAMTVQPEYQASERKVIRTKYKQDLFDGLVQTLEHRKRMIEVSVQLYGLDYFAKPSTRKGGDKYHEEASHAAFRRKRKVKKTRSED